MTRPIPQLANGYRVDDKSSRIYAARRGAYYQIAKALVVAKYPPGIEGPMYTPEYDGDGRETGAMIDAGWSLPTGWSEEKCEMRSEKAKRLFYRDDSFDVRRWQKFLHRVGRYLAFVDKRRTGRDRWSSLTDAQLTAKFEAAEGEAGRWMIEASAMRLELRRRESENA